MDGGKTHPLMGCFRRVVTETRSELKITFVQDKRGLLFADNFTIPEVS